MSVCRSQSQASTPVPGLRYGDITSVQMLNFTATHGHFHFHSVSQTCMDEMEVMLVLS